jgi:hypothetical protein
VIKRGGCFRLFVDLTPALEQIESLALEFPLVNETLDTRCGNVGGLVNQLAYRNAIVTTADDGSRSLLVFPHLGEAYEDLLSALRTNKVYFSGHDKDFLPVQGAPACLRLHS